jgi:hypothetical protein
LVPENPFSVKGGATDLFQLDCTEVVLRARTFALAAARFLLWWYGEQNGCSPAANKNILRCVTTLKWDRLERGDYQGLDTCPKAASDQASPDRSANKPDASASSDDDEALSRHWLDQLIVVVLFVGVIAFGTLQQAKRQCPWCGRWPWSIGDKLHRIASASYEPAKVGHVFWALWKHVEVSYPSPQVDKFFPDLSLRNILWRDGSCIRNAPAEHLREWADQSSHHTLFIIGKVVALRQKAVTHFTFRIGSQLSRGCGSDVAPSYLETPIEWTCYRVGWRIPRLPKTVGKYESSSIRHETFSREASLATGCHPQSSAKGGDNNCCERTNSVAVLVNKDAATSDVSDPYAAESGWIIVGGMGAFVLMLLIYASLET